MIETVTVRLLQQHDIFKFADADNELYLLVGVEDVDDVFARVHYRVQRHHTSHPSITKDRLIGWKRTVIRFGHAEVADARPSPPLLPHDPD